MSVTTDLPTVVQGEASESDDEVVDERNSRPLIAKQPVSATGTPSHQAVGNEKSTSVVVSGEASESDEEFQDVTQPLDTRSDLPPLKVKPEPRVKKPTAIKSPFDSLLHRKLREKNHDLFQRLQGEIGGVYTKSGRDIAHVGQQLSKSQTAMQEVSHNMRMLTNDLFHLEDMIDIVTACKLLPNINIQTPGGATGGSLPSSPVR